MMPVAERATIPFVKASACGNDFLIMQGERTPADIHDITRRACHRNQGIGADGVEWLFPASGADVRARLLNADGSEAEISGNGTRCVAAYLCSQQPRQSVSIETGAGVKVCTFLGSSGSAFEFEIAMGVPLVGGSKTLRIESGDVSGVSVSMGNPHFVVFVERFAHDWQRHAAAIGRDASFPRGVNVEVAVVRDAHTLETRFFERGVGETQSSGTGSCASAVAAIASSLALSPVSVVAPGGMQVVRWDGDVFLRGSAQLVCRGDFFI